MFITGLVVGFVLTAWAKYWKLTHWFSIPRNLWSQRLETDYELLKRMPKFMRALYGHNLAWRRNIAIRRSVRRQGNVGAPPLSQADADTLKKILKRSFDPRTRQLLTDKKI